MEIVKTGWKNTFTKFWLKQNSTYATILSQFLRPISWLYKIGITVRNLCYDYSIFQSYSIKTPIISIGNITSGGTGKTPLVHFLYEHLKNSFKIAIITRGYKSQAERQSEPTLVSDGQQILVSYKKGGDEALCLAEQCSEAIVISHSDRLKACHLAESLGCNLIILDDGFQHRRLQRTIDLIVLSTNQNQYRKALLPYGPYREPFNSLQRADHILIHSNASEKDLTSLKKDLKQHCKSISIYARSEPTLKCMSKQKPHEPYTSALITGIGDPGPLIFQLNQANIPIKKSILLDDHQDLTLQDWAKKIDNLQKEGINRILVTHKDHVKIPSLVTDMIPFYVIENHLVFLENEAELILCLHKQLHKSLTAHSEKL